MLNVKPYRQKAGYCGPASLKMVLGFYGVEKSEQELVKLTGCTKKKGTGAPAILKAARSLGFSGLIKDNCELSDISAFLKIGIPVIIDWFSYDDGHYSVVVALDKNNIFLQDPELGHIQGMNIKTFKRVWFDFQGDFLKSKKDLIVRRMIVLYR
jgi:predicted double-glycine peptidase